MGGSDGLNGRSTHCGPVAFNVSGNDVLANIRFQAIYVSTGPLNMNQVMIMFIQWVTFGNVVGNSSIILLSRNVLIILLILCSLRNILLNDQRFILALAYESNHDNFHSMDWLPLQMSSATSAILQRINYFADIMLFERHCFMVVSVFKFIHRKLGVDRVVLIWVDRTFRLSSTSLQRGSNLQFVTAFVGPSASFSLSFYGRWTGTWFACKLK